MRIALVAALCGAAIAFASAACAQDADTTTAETSPEPAPPASSVSITNPAISVIAWFQAMAGSDHSVQENAFELREAELALQSVVDPYARADFFASMNEEGLELEEGYLTWLTLPGGGQARVGKFRSDFGKFNRTHPPETPFADRPLAAAAFFGEEGLATTGLSLSALLPLPVYWEIVGNIGTAPDSLESPLFQPDARDDLLAVARTSAFLPMGESADWNLGVSYANGPAVPLLASEGTRAQVAGADLTFHWKNPRRSIYRSLLAQVEWMTEQGSGSGTPRRDGGFAYLIYQFARRWKIGARYDRTETPAGDGTSTGVLALLQFQPSEFSTVSLQARRVEDPDDRTHDAAFLKWTFNIGPHGAHPY